MAVCDPWTTEAELVKCGCPDDLLDSAHVTNVITAASEWLNEMTGQRFGVCTTTERPCRPCGCDTAYCICSGWEMVELTYGPISGTPTVTIDGAAFTAFEVIAPNYLRRTDLQAWPSCNSLTSGEGWSVTYDHGTAIPQLGRLAASDLVIELLRSCTGGACSLPAGTTSINQRGVTIQLDQKTAGETLPRVAMLLSAYPRKGKAGIMRLDRARGFVTSGPA